MKKDTKSVGRPKAKEPRIKMLCTILPSLKKSAEKTAFSKNLSMSRYIENLILADVKKSKKGGLK